MAPTCRRRIYGESRPSNEPSYCRESENSFTTRSTFSLLHLIRYWGSPSSSGRRRRTLQYTDPVREPIRLGENKRFCPILYLCEVVARCIIFSRRCEIHVPHPSSRRPRFGSQFATSARTNFVAILELQKKMKSARAGAFGEGVVNVEAVA